MKKYVVSTKTIINIFVATSKFIYIYKYEGGVLKDYYLFFDRTDRFADILKVIFSFKDEFSVQELLIWEFHRFGSTVILLILLKVLLAQRF